VRWNFEKGILTYSGMMYNNQFEYGLLQYLYEGAYGELGDLVKEVGIQRSSIPYYNVEKNRQFKYNLIQDPLVLLVAHLNMVDRKRQPAQLHS